MNEQEAQKKISDIIFNALMQKEEITMEQDKKIKKEIFDILEQIDKGGINERR